VSFVVDTNVLVYAADRDAGDHAVCRKRLERWRAQRPLWYVTWGIVYEFLRVVSHPQVMHKPWSARQAWGFVDALLEAPSLRVLTHSGGHAQVVAATLDAVPALRGNLFHDAHTAFLMREHGLRRIYTRDADFHRFEFLEVIDPVAEK
jgi:toxin-antitoxin system PIN domain toxin